MLGTGLGPGVAHDEDEPMPGIGSSARRGRMGWIR